MADASRGVTAVHDPEEVVDVLFEAFHDYPVMRFVLGPGRADYGRDLRTLIGFFVMSRALRSEHLLGVRGAGGGLEAAAIVSRPGAPAPPALSALREAVWSGLGDGARRRYEAFTAACTPFLPEGPHLHLNMIGVRQAVKGRGRGRMLLDHVHALSRDDSESDGVSLSTENPANVRIYEHVGYVVTGHAVVSPDLETWALYRPD
ncbi:MAG: GNAT family N-acetyltransferase [Gemmatimonadales bacterium]